MKKFIVLSVSLLLSLHQAQAEEQQLGAVVLNMSTETRYTDLYNIHYTHQQQIKILNSEGVKWVEQLISNTNAQLTDSSQTLTEGSTIVCSWQYDSQDYLHIDPWQPQCPMPVLSATYTLITPAEYQIEIEQQGNCNLRRFPIEEITLQYGNQPHNAKVQRFEGRNIPAFVGDDYIYNIYDYTTQIKAYVTSIKDSNGQIINLQKTWEQLDQLLIDNTLIRQFNTLGNPVGNKVAELKGKGYTVQPVLLRSRDKGRLDISRPDTTAFNHIIIAITNKNDTAYIDPYMPDNYEGMLSQDKRVITARMLEISNDKAKGSWVNPFASSKYNLVSNIKATIDSQGTIYINVNDYYRNYAADDQREVRHSMVDSTTYVNKLNQKNGISIQHFNDTGLNQSEPLYAESYDFIQQLPMHETGDSILFSPFFLINEGLKPIDLPDSLYINRTIPIEYKYCYNIRRNIVIEVDDSYEIESLPEPELYISSLGAYIMQFRIKAEGQRIEIVFQQMLNVMLQLPSAHELVMNLSDFIKNKTQETVVLRKKS